LEAVALRRVRGGTAGESALLVVKGPHAEALARVEEGTHLFCPAHENLVPVQVGVRPLADGEDPAAAFAALAESRRGWLTQLAEGTATVDDDPFRLRPVLRVYDEQGATLDLRTGLLSPTLPSPEARERFAHHDELPRDLAEAVRTFVLAALPLPPEFLSPS
jgi:hypothetical protein